MVTGETGTHCIGDALVSPREKKSRYVYMLGAPPVIQILVGGLETWVTRKRENEKTRKRENEKTRKRENEKTRRREDEKTRRRENEKTRKRENEKTRKRENEKTSNQSQFPLYGTIGALCGGTQWCTIWFSTGPLLCWWREK